MNRMTMLFGSCKVSVFALVLLNLSSCAKPPTAGSVGVNLDLARESCRFGSSTCAENVAEYEKKYNQYMAECQKTSSREACDEEVKRGADYMRRQMEYFGSHPDAAREQGPTDDSNDGDYCSVNRC